MLISFALLVIQMAQGFEDICHPATLGDEAWAKAECCCTENATDCDDRQNWILFEGYDDFAEKCPGKCQECECTESSISARIDGGVKVKTWTPEDEFHANGAPNLGFNI